MKYPKYPSPLSSFSNLQLPQPPLGAISERPEERDHRKTTMLLAPPDWLFPLRQIHRPNSPSRTRTTRLCCKASLITNSDSFEVGRLIGSYGFMNITRYFLINTVSSVPFLLLIAFRFYFIVLKIECFYCWLLRNWSKKNVLSMLKF